MNTASSVSGSNANQAELLEARKAAEAAGPAPPSPRGTATAPRRPIVPILPPLSEESLRAFTTNAAKLPAVVADLSLYTDQALEREIDASRGRSAKQPGPAGDGERLSLARLEGELLRRQTPKPVDVDSLASRPELEKAIHGEREFLTRHGGELAPAVRSDHERTLGALRERRSLLIADERVCDKARPSVATLSSGADRTMFTADDLVASLKKNGDLPPAAEAQARATFERWHRDTCRMTGQDPTVVVSRERYAEASVDHVAVQQAAIQKRVDMLDASCTSSAAALAFLASVARGDTVDAAHARVMSARALGDLANGMAAAGLPGPHVGQRNDAPPAPTSLLRTQP